MESRLAAIALGVAYADPRLIPDAIRQAYQDGASPEQVRTAVEVGCCLVEVPPAARLTAWDAAHAWAWIAHRREQTIFFQAAEGRTAMQTPPLPV